jgi:hypothetical protein
MNWQGMLLMKELVAYFIVVSEHLPEVTEDSHEMRPSV